MAGSLPSSASDPGIRGRSTYLHKACMNCRDATDPDQFVDPVVFDLHETSTLVSTPMRLRLLGVQVQPRKKKFQINIIGRLDEFLNRFSLSGIFFLDPLGFRLSARLALASGHPDLLTPALLNAFHLWRSHLSNNTDKSYAESEFLALAVQTLSHALPVANQPHLILPMIQAAVLVSYYFLEIGNLVEGKHHLAAALSLASCAGINECTTALSLPFSLSAALLPPSRDNVEATERLNAFWSLLLLNNFWVAASGLPSSTPYDIRQVYFPWPQDGIIQRVCTGILTIALFLDGTDHTTGSSPMALLIKGSILLERVVEFWMKHPNSGFADVTAFDRLSFRLETFEIQLPIVRGENFVAGPALQNLLATHCLTNVAIIRLHAPRWGSCAESNRKACNAAVRFVSDTTDGGMLQWETVDPIFGPLISTVYSFYMSRMNQIEGAATNMQTLWAVMSHFAKFSPLIRTFLVNWIESG
ncbi:hypothetical protein B0H11DRAFT_1933404 [Mycena galericulata]|nr:hypothetical protein B0H11DRAFT_1933404 [Mycena galericulata]